MNPAASAPLDVTPAPHTERRPNPPGPARPLTSARSSISANSASPPAGRAPVANSPGLESEPARAGDDIVVRAATARDLYATSHLQVARLGLGLFPRLGERFVRAWHATYLGSPDGIALVATAPTPSGTRTVGFLIGSSDEEAQLRHVLNEHRAPLLRSGLAALVVRPRVAARFARTRLARYARRLARRPGPSTAAHPGNARTGPEHNEPVRTGVLTALAVDPRWSGRGVGRQLTVAYLERARAGGTRTARLVTRADAGSAAGFYERLGWSRGDEVTSVDGDRLLAMSYSLDGRGTST